MTRREIIDSWSSTALCAFSVAVAIYYNSGGGMGVWINVIIFLPMCFFFVGTALYRQHKAIQELRQEVARLRKGDVENVPG